MKNKILAILLVLTLMGALSSCKTSMIDAKVIEAPLFKVLDRHDAYVKADKKLTELARKVYLKTSELLRKLVKEAVGE